MKKEKVTLIIPRSSFLLDERVFPFLGILQIAAVLENAGHEVDVLDLSGLENWKEVLNAYFQENQSENLIVGLTATSPQAPDAFNIAKYLKKYFKYKKLILGGTHASLSYAAKKLEDKEGRTGRGNKAVKDILDFFDVLVSGEGELAIFHAISSDDRIVDADSTKSKYFVSKKVLGSLPLPARHLIDLDSYKYFIEGKRATSFISELACPYNCNFCSGRNTTFLRVMRPKGISQIINEIRFLYKTYKYEGFMDYSDEINLPKNFVEYINSLKELQNELGASFTFRGFAKAELLTDEQAKGMYEAGFRWLLTGFESGDDRILKNINKRATKDDNTRAVEIAKRNGLKVKALMSIGHAGESPETIKNTMDWLLEVEPDDFDVTVITPYVGSPYHDSALFDGKKWVYSDPNNGDKLYQKAVDYKSEADYYKGIPGEYVSHVWTDFLSPKDLTELRDEVEAKVRKKLKIPFNPSNPTKKYEHSMGQGNLPDWILRSAKGKQEKKRKVGLKVV